HADAGKEPLVRELSRLHPVAWDSPLLLVRVLKTGEPALVSEVTETLLQEVSADADYLALLRALEPRSFVCVPLTARDTVFGAIGFILSRPGRHYDADDLTRPQQTARRASVAIETSRPLIDAQGHELTVRLPTEPVWLEADPMRLAQVLGNLLNNAAKYSERGGRIALTAECRTGEVVLRVKDTGIGIAADMLPRV